MKNRTTISVLAVVGFFGLGMDLVAGCKDGSCGVSRRSVSVNKARSTKASRAALAKAVLVKKATQDKSEQQVKAPEETAAVVEQSVEEQAGVEKQKEQSQVGILARLAVVWKKFTGLFS